MPSAEVFRTVEMLCPQSKRMVVSSISMRMLRSHSARIPMDYAVFSLNVVISIATSSSQFPVTTLVDFQAIG
jgi:hypothetical protein